MNITIKSELNKIKLVSDYRNMTAALIVHEINCLLIDGHKITAIIDLDNPKNKGE
jgi:hypothetical protein